jgi:hypothetical protein
VSVSAPECARSEGYAAVATPRGRRLDTICVQAEVRQVIANDVFTLVGAILGSNPAAE